MKVLGDVRENGIQAGNAYNKYETSNPVAKWLMKGFKSRILELLNVAAPKTVYEVGCGEGYWTIFLRAMGYEATGSDFSVHAIETARQNAANQKEGAGKTAEFFVNDIYKAPDISAPDLVLALEVLEHLEKPEEALRAIRSLGSNWFLCSVPDEPVWRLLNLMRGKYCKDFGNTPGHIQHWSSKRFISLLQEYFSVVEVRRPLPWTIVLCKGEGR